MPLASLSSNRPIDYSMIYDAKPAGPAIGIFSGREIFESIVDGFGRLYVYTGVAPRRLNGAFAVERSNPANSSFGRDSSIAWRSFSSATQRR